MVSIIGREMREAQSFLYYRLEESKAKQKKEASRDYLKDLMMSDEELDDGSGNRIILFDPPLFIDGKTYRGISARASKPRTFLNVDRAFEYADNHDLRDDLVEVTVVENIDQNALAVLNQEGVIPDEDLYGLYDIDEPRWSIYAVEE